ncbi:MAG: type II toxin-antitoxin system VapC family toxin [Pyrinomonadaceae bacterium]
MAIGIALPDTSLALDSDMLTAWRYQKREVLGAIAAYQSQLKLFLALTSMTVYEAIYGFENKSFKPNEPNEQTRQDRLKTEQLIKSCVVLPFDQRAAEIAAYIVPRLSKNMPKELLRDVFIAATALAHRYGIATRNKKDFDLIANHIPDGLILRIADW